MQIVSFLCLQLCWCVKHFNVSFICLIYLHFNWSLKVPGWSRHLQFEVRVRWERERQGERQRQTREMSGHWERAIISKTVDHISSITGMSQSHRQWNPRHANSSFNLQFCQRVQKIKVEGTSLRSRRSELLLNSHRHRWEESHDFLYRNISHECLEENDSYFHLELVPLCLVQLFYIRHHSQRSNSH